MDLHSWTRHLAGFPFGASMGTCPHCAAWLGPGHSSCRRCLDFLNEIHGHPHVFKHPLKKTIRCRSLIDWVPGESDQLSQALLDLKGAGAKVSWSRWAGHFLERHAKGLFQQDVDYVLWPVPPANSRRRHATDFAEALGQSLGCEILKTVDPKLNSESTSQKRRRRSERLRWLSETGPESAVAAAPADLGVGIQSGTGQKRLIIVDDILTTGATSLWWARQIASGADVEVWTLAHRSRLAP